MLYTSITWCWLACAYTKSSWHELLSENKQSKPASIDFSLLPVKTAEKQSASAVCHSFSQLLRVTLLFQRCSKRPGQYTQILDNEFQLWKIKDAPNPTVCREITSRLVHAVHSRLWWTIGAQVLMLSQQRSHTRGMIRFLDFMFGLGKLPTRWGFINPLQSMHKLTFVALLAYSVDYLP